MIDGIYLRLAGVLQSWAGPAIAGNIVHTERFPTRTGLKGLLAGALGAPRDDWPEWLEDVEFTVRQDHQPHIIDEYQTINQRIADKNQIINPRTKSTRFRKRLLLAHGDKPTRDVMNFTPGRDGKTAEVNRTYLADGEFIVRIVSDAHLDELESALSSPSFTSYLGRKAFPPAFPFYLGRGSVDYFKQIPTLDWHSHARRKVTRPDAGTGIADVRTADSNAASDSVLPRTTPLIFVEYSPYTGPDGKRMQCAVPLATDQTQRLQAISDLLSIRRELDSPPRGQVL